MRGVRGVVSRHRGALLRAVVVLAGILALAPLVGVDPGVLGLLLDLDFVVVIGAVGVGLLRADAVVVARRLAGALPVLWLRVGVALTRDAPRTLTP
jgi:hypothetical protein